MEKRGGAGPVRISYNVPRTITSDYFWRSFLFKNRIFSHAFPGFDKKIWTNASNRNRKSTSSLFHIPLGHHRRRTWIKSELKFSITISARSWHFCLFQLGQSRLGLISWGLHRNGSTVGFCAPTSFENGNFFPEL